MKKEEFLLSHSLFAGSVGEAQTADLGETAAGQTLRYVEMIYHVLKWFEQHPALQTIKLTTMVQVESSKDEWGGVDVRIRHHVRLVPIGATIPELEHPGSDEGPHHDFVSQHVPYKDMSDGMFEIHRHDPRVQRWLALCQDEFELADAWEIVFGLAWICVEKMSAPSIGHDLGLASARFMQQDD